MTPARIKELRDYITGNGTPRDWVPMESKELLELLRMVEAPKIEWKWSDEKHEWNLMHGPNPADYSATVFANGVWHTWDKSGTGGENSYENSVSLAKMKAASSAIDQGFI